MFINLITTINEGTCLQDFLHHIICSTSHEFVTRSKILILLIHWIFGMMSYISNLYLLFLYIRSTVNYCTDNRIIIIHSRCTDYYPQNSNSFYWHKTFLKNVVSKYVTIDMKWYTFVHNNNYMLVLHNIYIFKLSTVLYGRIARGSYLNKYMSCVNIYC